MFVYKPSTGDCYCFADRHKTVSNCANPETATGFKTYAIDQATMANCTDYMTAKGCGWTADSNCPGQASGQIGSARDDGRLDYECCCVQQLWKVPNLARNKPVNASSSPHQCGKVVDGSHTSFWAAERYRWNNGRGNPNHTEWLQIDLQSVYQLAIVRIRWKECPWKYYSLEGSNDGTTWITLSSNSVCRGFEDPENGGLGTSIPPGNSFQYVRVYGTAYAITKAMEIYEFEVYELQASVPAGYIYIPGACVNGANIYPSHLGKTVAECKALCNANSACLAFEFSVVYGGRGSSYSPGECRLQSSSAHAGCDGLYMNLDLYVKAR
jgi:hypothetical protein